MYVFVEILSIHTRSTESIKRGEVYSAEPIFGFLLVIHSYSLYLMAINVFASYS